MLLQEFTNNLKTEICQSINNAFSDATDISPDAIQFSTPPNSDMGDYAIACFPFAKALKKAPVAIATDIAASFAPSNLVSKMQAVGPYLNIFINKTLFNEAVCRTVMTSENNYGRGEKKNKTVMIEYSSPNTNKPLHLGHLRNNILGMAIANILDFYGYDVIKVNLVNDRGIHICKSMLAYEKWGEGETPESCGEKGDHFVGKYYVLFDNKLEQEKKQYANDKSIDLEKLAAEIESLKQQVRNCKEAAEKKQLRKQLKETEKTVEEFNNDFLTNSQLYNDALTMLKKWENNDTEVRQLWKTMNSWVMDGFHQTYDKLGCKFDKFYFESDTFSLGKQHVEDGAQKGVFAKHDDNSIWVSGESLKKQDPQTFKKFSPKDKLLLRADGTSVYITQDIGTTILKNEDKQLDQCLFVVGEEQELHFKTLFSILGILGFPWWEKCRHISYGMVNLPEGKLKSRKGTRVDADELVKEMEQRVVDIITANEKIDIDKEQIASVAEDIALAALKLFLLNISREKSLLFDPHKAISSDSDNAGKSGAIAFTGDTGPYIQYGYARICGIFRNANATVTTEIDYTLLNSKEEQAVLQKVADFPQVVANAAQNDSPHFITTYLLDLTKALFKFYGVHQVICDDENTKQARLLLCKVVAQVIHNGMKLLGMNVPERM